MNGHAQWEIKERRKPLQGGTDGFPEVNSTKGTQKKEFLPRPALKQGTFFCFIPKKKRMPLEKIALPLVWAPCPFCYLLSLT